MDQRTVRGTIDLRSLGSDDAGQRVGDELAACLERFLAATADERSLERSRDALAQWYRLTDRFSVSFAT